MWSALVAADSAAQLLFKAAALALEPPAVDAAWLAMVAQSPRVWLAVGFLLLTFGLWMLVLRRHAISSAFPVTSLTIVAVAACSVPAFGETLGPVRLAGIALIVAGVAMLRPADPAEGPSNSR